MAAGQGKPKAAKAAAPKLKRDIVHAGKTYAAGDAPPELTEEQKTRLKRIGAL